MCESGEIIICTKSRARSFLGECFVHSTDLDRILYVCDFTWKFQYTVNVTNSSSQRYDVSMWMMDRIHGWKSFSTVVHRIYTPIKQYMDAAAWCLKRIIFSSKWHKFIDLFLNSVLFNLVGWGIVSSSHCFLRYYSYEYAVRAYM